MKEVICKTLRESKTSYKTDVPEQAVKYWREVVSTKDDFDSEKECLVALVLNSKLFVKAHYVVSIGLNNQTLCHSREVFRAAIVLSGAHVILMHNHPSGDSQPSPDDIRTTRELVEAGKIIGIPLLDHVVVGDDNFRSLKSMGLINS
jgi:DNA repair protein RadC